MPKGRRKNRDQRRPSPAEGAGRRGGSSGAGRGNGALVEAIQARRSQGTANSEGVSPHTNKRNSAFAAATRDSADLGWQLLESMGGSSNQVAGNVMPSLRSMPTLSGARSSSVGAPSTCTQ